MRKIRWLFIFLTLGGRLLVLYLTVQPWLRPIWPYARLVLALRSELQQMWRELRQIQAILKGGQHVS
jgi:hypothetical protein